MKSLFRYVSIKDQIPNLFLHAFYHRAEQQLAGFEPLLSCSVVKWSSTVSLMLVLFKWSEFYEGDKNSIKIHFNNGSLAQSDKIQDFEMKVTFWHLLFGYFSMKDYVLILFSLSHFLLALSNIRLDLNSCSRFQLFSVLPLFNPHWPKPNSIKLVKEVIFKFSK